MPFFKLKNNCRIYYENHHFKEKRPVVVFLNGTTQTTRTWGLQVRHLKNNFRILLYDARGQGQSDLGQEDLSLDGHVDDLIELLNHLGLGRVHLVGLSHGARIACRIGACAPERTDRIVLCGLGTNLNPRTAALLSSWNHILHHGNLETMVWAMLPAVFGEPFLEQHKSILNEMVSVIVNCNRAEAIKVHLNSMINYLPVTDSIQKDYPPTLIVAGNQDLITPIDQSRELAQMLGAHLVRLKGVGHSHNMEAPEAFNQVILEFLLANQ